MKQSISHAMLSPNLANLLSVQENLSSKQYVAGFFFQANVIDTD